MGSTGTHQGRIAGTTHVASTGPQLSTHLQTFVVRVSVDIEVILVKHPLSVINHNSHSKQMTGKSGPVISVAAYNW